MTELAYEYWNQLYQLDREFRNIQFLVPQLRREMDTSGKSAGRESEGTVLDHSDDWLRDAFPADFLWNICGLKAAKTVDLAGILASTRADTPRDDGIAERKNPAHRARRWNI